MAEAIPTSDKLIEENTDRADSFAPTSALSLRRNFSWTFVGNAVYAASSWGMLVVLAKLGDPEMVGQFALGLAVTAPVIMFTNLQLRAVQATDAKEDFVFGDYLGLRLLTAVLAFLVILAITLFSDYKAETVAVILVIGIGKVFDSISDIFWGFFQQHERMDYIAKSMMLNGIFSLVALTCAIYVTRNVLWGAAAWSAVSAANLLTYNVPAALRFSSSVRSSIAPHSLRPRLAPAKSFKLARLALPLGVVMLLISLNSNIPRYVIQAHYGEWELGIFAATAYIMVAGTTVVSALGQSASPRLAKLYGGGKRLAYLHLLVRLLGIGAMLGIGGVLITWVAGETLLRLLYNSDYAAYSDVFLLVMVAAAVNYVSSFLGYGMTAARYFSVQAPLFILVIFATALASLRLIPSYGLQGAAVAMIIASLVQLGGSVVILARIMNHFEQHQGQSHAL